MLVTPKCALPLKKCKGVALPLNLFAISGEDYVGGKFRMRKYWKNEKILIVVIKWNALIVGPEMNVHLCINCRRLGDLHGHFALGLFLALRLRRNAKNKGSALILTLKQLILTQAKIIMNSHTRISRFLDGSRLLKFKSEI